MLANTFQNNCKGRTNRRRNTGINLTASKSSSSQNEQLFFFLKGQHWNPLESQTHTLKTFNTGTKLCKLPSELAKQQKREGRDSGNKLLFLSSLHTWMDFIYGPSRKRTAESSSRAKNEQKTKWENKTKMGILFGVFGTKLGRPPLLDQQQQNKKKGGWKLYVTSVSHLKKLSPACVWNAALSDYVRRRASYL